MKTSRSRIKTSRNENIIKDYDDGMPIKEMIAKYKISRQRIWEIWHRNY